MDRNLRSDGTIFRYTRMIKSRIVMFLFLFGCLNSLNAQVFWKEDFSNGGIKVRAAGYSSPAVKGIWTVDSLGVQAPNANEWFVGEGEVGRKPGECSNDVIIDQKNGSLHISTSADIKATYSDDPTAITKKRVSSPPINLTGKLFKIKLQFDFICLGDITNNGNDRCDLEYSVDNGGTWKILTANLVSASCTPSTLLSLWRSFDILLPTPEVDTATKFKFGFKWTNNGDNITHDPSFAVDNIRLSVDGVKADSALYGPLCAGGSVKVPFTSEGTFDPTNVYTAQLSDSIGSFANPVDIGVVSSILNVGVINAIIPINTKPGTKYRIRVNSSSPAFTGTDNGHDIIIDAPIKVSVTPNPDTICLGQKVKLKATGAQNYVWSNLPIASITDSLVTTPLTDVTYFVTGTTGACKSVDSAKIKVDIPPIVKVAIDSICKGMTAVLAAIVNGSGTVKYLWSTGSVNDSIFVNPAKDTSYTVIVTKGKCVVKDTGYVKVFDSIKVTVNSPTTCVGVPVTLTAKGAIAFVWSTVPPQNTSSIIVSPLVTTAYTVTGTAGACSDKATATVTIVPGPDVKITASPTEICKGESVSLSATGADKYIWDTGDTTNVVTKKPLVTTTYGVIGNKAGCKSTATITVTVSTPPTVLVTPAAVCLGQPAILIATGATNYVWITTPPVSGDTLIVTPKKDTSYMVVGFTGVCKDTAIGFVKVGKNTRVTVTGDTYIYACETANLKAMPADGTYSWEPSGTVDCRTCSSVTVSPLNTQSYKVTYTSPFGCVAEDSLTVTVLNLNSYYMPTALTPNGDGINDVVKVHGRGIAKVSLTIFDRLGEKVFETNELEKGWDGTVLGITMNDNVFVYRLKLEYCDGVVIKETGNITIVR